MAMRACLGATDPDRPLALCDAADGRSVGRDGRPPSWGAAGGALLCGAARDPRGVCAGVGVSCAEAAAEARHAVRCASCCCCQWPLLVASDSEPLFVFLCYRCAALSCAAAAQDQRPQYPPNVSASSRTPALRMIFLFLFAHSIMEQKRHDFTLTTCNLHRARFYARNFWCAYNDSILPIFTLKIVTEYK